VTGQPAAGAADGRDPRAEAVLASLAEIPHRARVFSLGTEEARTRLRVRPRLLALLEAGGFTQWREGQSYFDVHDVINVELESGGGPLTWSILRLWPKLLNSLEAAGPVAYEVGFDAECPSPGHPGGCDFAVRLPDGRALPASPPAGAGEPLARLVVERPGAWPELPGAARDIIGEMSGIRFIRLPLHVPWDMDAFVTRTGLADCGVFARLMAERANSRGVAMRPAFGLMLTPPVAIEHNWVEVAVDGTWVPIDPLMISALVARDVLDRKAWPAHRSPGTTLLRLAAEYTPVACTHRGSPVAVTYRSKLIR
jgi:transglutaminase superfamily protein